MNSVATLTLKPIITLATLFLLAVVTIPSYAQATVTGTTRLWHKVTLTFDGPSVAEDDTNNPFLNYRMDVTFTHSSGQSLTAPGYFAADGNAANTGAMSGDQWRVHFMPTLTGTWTYDVAFYAGPDVATASNPASVATDTPDPHGQTGTLSVTNTNKSAPDFRYHGLLSYVGEHYMQFQGSGDYYLKHGADSPENLLGYVDFDATYDTGGIDDGFLHEYAPHSGDWRSGDPQWSGNRGRNLIGAINYLASQDVNSIYFITYNLDGGDGADTWPWTSDTERERFDVSKLDQWEIVFSHMTANGIQLHMLTQENENDNILGGDSTLNGIRRLYFRELVARFSHHPALQWNLGEENDNSDAQRISFANYIRDLDPYNHPITVHSFYNVSQGGSPPDNVFYDGLLGNSFFNATSIQGDANRFNEWAILFRERSSNAGQPWVVYGDEQGPAVNEDMSNVNVIIRDGLWGNLMGGGAGAEWYFGYQGCCFGDLQSEDWRVAEPLWQLGDIAIDFFYDHLPFWEMESANNLTSSTTGSSWTFAKTEEVYAIYLMDGAADNPELDLGSSTEAYDIFWFDPLNGGDLETGSTVQVVGPGVVSLGTPLGGDTSADYVALIQVGTLINTEPEFVAVDTVFGAENRTSEVAVQADDDDAVITLTAQVIRDSDNAAMDDAFYSFNSQPDGNGLFVFQPVIGDAGDYTVTVSADDGTNPPVELIFSLTVIPFDGAGFIFTQVNGKSRTSEPDGTDTLSVQLNTEPIDTVVLDITSNNINEIRTDTLQLVFDNTNWSTPQVVTLLGQDDLIADGNQQVTITFDPSNSIDTDYATLTPYTLIAINRDDDGGGSDKSDQANNDPASEALLTDNENIFVNLSSENEEILKILTNSELLLPATIVTWQVLITNTTDQTITDLDAELLFSTDDLTILNVSASAGTLNSDVIALQAHRRRVYGKPPDLSQTFLRPRVTYSHTDIAPGQTIRIDINSRLKDSPTSSEVKLTATLTLGSLNNSTVDAEKTLPIVTLLPQTGESPQWRNYTIVILIAVFMGALLPFVLRRISFFR